MATTKMRKVLGLALAGLVLTSTPLLIASQEGTPKPEGSRPGGTKPEGSQSKEEAKKIGELFRNECKTLKPPETLRQCCNRVNDKLCSPTYGASACKASFQACLKGQFVS